MAKLTPAIIEAIAQNLGHEMLTPEILGQISSMPPEEQWRRFLEWHGILGWSETLHLVHELIFIDRNM